MPVNDTWFHSLTSLLVFKCCLFCTLDIVLWQCQSLERYNIILCIYTSFFFKQNQIHKGILYKRPALVQIINGSLPVCKFKHYHSTCKHHNLYKVKYSISIYYLYYEIRPFKNGICFQSSLRHTIYTLNSCTITAIITFTIDIRYCSNTIKMSWSTKKKVCVRAPPNKHGL